MITTAPICTSLMLSGSLCNMLYTIIFPWVITFAIIFGLLIKTKIFGEESNKTARGVSGLIALAVGFFVTAATPVGTTMGNFFINTSGTLMLFLFVILGILLVIGLTNSSFMPSTLASGWKGFLALLIVVLLAWFLLGGWLGGGIGFYALFTRDAMALLIILAVIAAMWYFVGSSEGKPKEEKKKE
jgi:hypothetical protein